MSIATFDMIVRQLASDKDRADAHHSLGRVHALTVDDAIIHMRSTTISAPTTLRAFNFWTRYLTHEVRAEYGVGSRYSMAHPSSRIWHATNSSLRNYLVFMCHMLNHSGVADYAYTRKCAEVARLGYRKVDVAADALKGIDRPKSVIYSHAVAVAITAEISHVEDDELVRDIEHALDVVRMFTVGDTPLVDLIHTALPDYILPLTEVGMSWEAQRQMRQHSFLTETPERAIRDTFDLLTNKR